MGLIPKLVSTITSSLDVVEKAATGTATFMDAYNSVAKVTANKAETWELEEMAKLETQRHALRKQKQSQENDINL